MGCAHHLGAAPATSAANYRHAGKILQQRLSPPEAESELKLIIDQLLTPDDQKQADMQRRVIDEACVNLSGLHQLTRPDQRFLAREKFISYTDDFRYLARNR